MVNSEIKPASVLAFERKLCNSDGVMYAGRWDEKDNSKSWKPIKIQNKDVRGTISNRLKPAIAKDPLKLDAEIQKPNLQTVDVASLPFECDTLKLNFSLKILGNLASPSACNSPTYQKALGELIASYTKEVTFEEISWRYAENIANGRFLWRNRIGSDDIEVRVKHVKAKHAPTTANSSWTFDALSFRLGQFSKSPNLKELAALIHEALAGFSFAFLEIETFTRLGCGQEVFPSQELILDKTGNSKKSKYLYAVNDVAAMHSQKIGNALRTIDTWHSAASDVGPIAVEPYGSVTSRGIAYRQPKEGLDFYTILDGWILKGKEPSKEQQHFVIAGLIRGGVYGEKSK
jgi:CRISPR-associated protein Csy3